MESSEEDIVAIADFICYPQSFFYLPEFMSCRSRKVQVGQGQMI